MVSGFAFPTQRLTRPPTGRRGSAPSVSRDRTTANLPLLAGVPMASLAPALAFDKNSGEGSEEKPRPWTPEPPEAETACDAYPTGQATRRLPLDQTPELPFGDLELKLR